MGHGEIDGRRNREKMAIDRARGSGWVAMGWGAVVPTAGGFAFAIPASHWVVHDTDHVTKCGEGNQARRRTGRLQLHAMGCSYSPRES